MKKHYFIICTFITISFFAQNTCLSPISILSANSFSTGSLTQIGTINGTATTLVCAQNGNGQTASEWYKFTPSVSTNYTLTTNLTQNNPRIDTRLHLYSGTCESLICIGGDDDTGTNNSSVLQVNLTAGVTYLIAFDNKWTSTGFWFQIVQTPTPQNPIVTTPVTFTNVSQTINGTGICVVDMNSDYRDDIVGVSTTNIQIKEQNSDGSFTLKNAPTSSNIAYMPTWSLAAGDIDKNGFNDLVLGGGSGVSFLYANATGTGYTHTSNTNYVFSQRSNMVDLNKDGHLDVFVCHDVAPNVYYKNNGTGTLNFMQGGIGNHPNGGNYGSIFVDYDNDGDSDLFIAKCRGGNANGANINEMHRNDGNYVFTDVSDQLNLNDPIQTWSSAWADYDNDGDMDALVGASSMTNGSHKLMKNTLINPTTPFEPFENISENSGWHNNISTNIEHIAHDFDNDGWVDVLGGGNKIMYNNRNLTFSSATAPFTQGAVGDLNNDGFLDVFLNGVIYRNNGNSNNWIKINLKGIQSNYNGIGARVEIYGAFGKQIRDVRSGEGFKFMSSLTTHFGIGTNTSITQVKVIWPSGLVDLITNPIINQSLTIIEGSALSRTDLELSKYEIYPNPANSLLTINGNKQIQKIEIYDNKGMKIKININNNTLDVSNLSSGIYFIKIYDENNLKTDKKFIKI